MPDESDLDVTPQDTSPSSSEVRPPTVVGIGTSAGGLAALRRFFSRVPEDSGLAYVVIIHLSPDHESHLAEILQPHARLPVIQVTDTVPLEVNRVYVIPPDANLEAVDTHLRLSVLEQRPRDRVPIDHFFRTLARTHDGHAVGVVLTGTGSDGALGIKAIREKGGVTIAQDPAEAEHDSMPLAAISTGFVDLVLPLDEIPDAVLRISRTEPRVRGLRKEMTLVEEERHLLFKILALVHASTGRDFGRYKQTTILRRISRRMQLHRLERLEDYLDLLSSQPEEAGVLADEFLITVTDFFRDREVFDQLEAEVVPQIFVDKQAGDDVRVWSVGCATGEEAYSLAMLLLERADRCDLPVHLQIFASDLHEHSLERARDGFYPGDIATDVGPQRLERFFDQVEGGYRVGRRLRETVIFAPHDLLADPPFSRLDLVTCRNLLIYLERDVQKEVTELFHYALRPGGFLLLGTSERADRSELFAPLGLQSCVYRRRDVPTPQTRLPVFPLATGRLGPAAERGRTEERPSYGRLHARIVERYAPPSLLVNSDDAVVHLSEHVGRYLVHAGGSPTNDIFRLVREELRLELRTAISAARAGQASRSDAIVARFDDGERSVVLDVHPARLAEDEGFVLVIFDERSEHPPLDLQSPSGLLGPEAGAPAGDDGDRDRAVMQQRLQVIVEEYQTSREEMKATNEELQSTNEELRSTLEELETSKEELQSMNEELQTVNQENRHKVEELDQLSTDLQNLLAATGIATLFLDRDLRILRFTPRIEELFSIRSVDRGRPVRELTSKLGYETLEDDATAVLEGLVPVEREVRDTGNRWYLTRVLPYRSTDDRIAGVVITFVDVTERKRASEALQASEEELAARLRAMTRLHELVSHLLVSRDEETAFEQVLGAVVEITDAAQGSVQLFDPSRGHLELVAHRGLTAEFIEHFQKVTLGDSTACARVLEQRKRVIIEDVEVDPDFAPHREIAARQGFRSVQSTPLLSRSGDLLGVLNTYYAQPGRPSSQELLLLDLYARQASEFVEHVRTQERMRQAERRKDEFLAMLGHELRNPLSPIVSALELLRLPALDDDRRVELLDMIERQERQLSRLVDDLLDVSRITQGKIQLQTEVLDLEAVAEEALEMHRAHLEQWGQTVDLTREGEPVTVEGDRVRLVQVVGNLVHNASKYSPRDQTIEIRIATEGDEAVLTVTDQGLGMSSELQDHAFELFAQGDRTMARSEGGLGVGLTTVHRLVEMHGGSVLVDSEGLDRGSTFTVRLPVSEGLPAELEPAAPPEASSESRPASRTILLVEDNEDTADALCDLLGRYGHVCRAASDGFQAVELFSAHHPEVVLMDIGLPRMDGFEVAERIRQTPAGRRALLIALTGYGAGTFGEDERSHLFDHHVLKPVDLDRIKRLLAEG